MLVSLGSSLGSMQVFSWYGYHLLGSSFQASCVVPPIATREVCNLGDKKIVVI